MPTIQQQPYRQQLYGLLRSIPKGKVSTYKDMATFLGIPTKSRWIGRLLGLNDEPVTYPCYKVVASDGNLTGYSAPGGIVTKRKKLEADGVHFKANGKVDLSLSRWIPRRTP